MSRTMIAIALSLAVLTGIVLGQLTAMETTGVGRPLQRSPERRLELVRSFYAGVNDYLENADPGFLSLLAPGFKDVGILSTEPGSAESLVARLDALRASTAVPSFEIDEIHDLGQVIQVRLSAGLSNQLEAGGFTISGFEGSGALEFLQVQGDAIVARWGQDERIPRIDMSISEEFAIGRPHVLTIETELIRLDTGAEWRPASTGAVWLIVEQGSVALDTESEFEILTGHESWSGSKGILRIRNRAEGTSSVLVVSIASDTASQSLIPGQSVSGTAGVTIAMRAWSTFFDPPVDFERIRIELSRIATPPGTNLDPGVDALGHQVMAIEGSLDADIHHGQLLHITEPDFAITVRDRMSMSSRSAATTLPGASASYRVSSPGGAELLLVTIAPAVCRSLTASTPPALVAAPHLSPPTHRPSP